LHKYDQIVSKACKAIDEEPKIIDEQAF